MYRGGQSILSMRATWSTMIKLNQRSSRELPIADLVLKSGHNQIKILTPSDHWQHFSIQIP